MTVRKMLLRGVLSLGFALLILGNLASGAQALEIPDRPEYGAVSAGMHYTAYLTPEGTVRSTMSSHQLQDWTDIVALDAGPYHIIGLRSDGTVVTTDTSVNLSGWKNIVKVSAGDGFYVGLKCDGTVVAKGASSKGQCRVSSWKNIVDISAGIDHTVAVRADGTAVATGKNDTGECDVKNWEDIVQISTLQWYTIGLKSDGTVVVAGGPDNDLQRGPFGELGWTDIVCVSAGWDAVYGLHRYDDVMVYKTQYTFSSINPQQSLDWGLDREISSMDAGFYHLACMGAYGDLYFTGGAHNGETDACRLLAEKGRHLYLPEKGGYRCTVCAYQHTPKGVSGYCEHYPFSEILSDDPAVVTHICNQCGAVENYKFRELYSSELFSRLISGSSSEDVEISFTRKNFKGVTEAGVHMRPTGESVACFDVKKDAGYFVGKIVTGMDCPQDVSMTLTIFLDDQLLMSLQNLTYETEIPLELNLTGVNTLKVVCSDYSGTVGHCILTGFLLP